MERLEYIESSLFPGELRNSRIIFTYFDPNEELITCHYHYIMSLYDG